MADQPTIAVLGAGGTMGFPMAKNLRKAGFPVRAWNRSRERAEPLTQEGADVFSSPQEAAEGAHIVLTMLTDTEAVLETARAALSTPSAETVWLQMSTIGEAGTERCLDLARELSVGFVDAPVSGTREPAEQGKLVVLGSGTEKVRGLVQPILDVIGQRTVWVGEAGTGTKLKLAINAWLVSVVEGAAETLAFAQALGLDPHLVLDSVQGGPLDLPYLQLKGKAMLAGNFDPSFKLGLAAKDTGLVAEAIASRGLDLPVLEAIRRRFVEGSERHGDKDMSATFLTSAQED